jgi:hypothetical protein
MKKLTCILIFWGSVSIFRVQASSSNIEVKLNNAENSNSNQIENASNNAPSTIIASNSVTPGTDLLGQLDANTNSCRIFGTHVDYSVELPNFSDWKIFRDSGPGNNDIDAAYQNIHITFNAKGPTMEDIKQVISRVKYNSRRSCPDIQFSHPNAIVLDGLNFTHLYSTYEDSSNHEKYATSGYIYSGPEGFFSIFGICPANTFAASKEIFDQIAKTWKRGPKMISEYKNLAQKINSSDKLFDVDNSDVAIPERVESVDGIFSVENPDSIQWKFQKIDGQLTLVGNDITFVITFSKLGYEHSEDVLEIIDNSFRGRSEIYKPSDPATVEIDGFKWLAVHYTTRINSLPLAGIYYVFTCDKGTFTMTGSTGTNLIKENSKIIEKLAQSFRFAPNLKRDIIPSKPRTIPKTYLPKKKSDNSNSPDINPVTSLAKNFHSV